MNHQPLVLPPLAIALVLIVSGFAQAQTAGSDAASHDAPVITVTASEIQENAYGFVAGYIATRSATGTKTDTPIIETPQSISVVGAEQIEVMKPQNLTEALNYVAGVDRFEGFNRSGEMAWIRGFQANVQNYYRDGSRYLRNAYDGQLETYGLERIEVLKGASSVLYGVAAPGGIINTVTKRPSTSPIRELNIQGGSFNRKQVSGDFSDSFSDESDWSYRLTFLYRDSDAFVDYVRDNRIFIAHALKWQPDGATSFTLLGEYQRDDTNYVYGLPAVGTVYPNINGQIPRNLFPGEKNREFDHDKLNRKTLGYIFEHEFSQNTRLRHSLRYMHVDGDLVAGWVDGLSADQRSALYKGFQKRNSDSRVVTSDSSVQHKWQAGPVQNILLTGMDYTYSSYRDSRNNRDILGAFDYFSPRYDQPIGDTYAFSNGQEKEHRLGLYLQNQAKILDKWVVLLNLRQDWSRDAEENSLAIGEVTEKTKALTGRMGFVYLAANGLSPFFSYSQSFEPVSGADRNGSRFKPTEGEQYELGMRYQPPGQDVLLSAVIYDLTQKNITVTDPVDRDFSIQHGKVRSRGVELETRTKLWKDTNLIAAYTYTDARTLKSSPLTPDQNGKRTGAVPYNQISVWIDHSFESIGIPGFKAGLGSRYVAATKGAFTTADVSAYTVFDAMVSYTRGSWRVALNASNLSNKTYIASCTYGCFYGEARNIIGTVSYRW